MKLTTEKAKLWRRRKYHKGNLSLIPRPYLYLTLHFDKERPINPFSRLSQPAPQPAPWSTPTISFPPPSKRYDHYYTASTITTSFYWTEKMRPGNPMTRDRSLIRHSAWPSPLRLGTQWARSSGWEPREDLTTRTQLMQDGSLLLPSHPHTAPVDDSKQIHWIPHSHSLHTQTTYNNPNTYTPRSVPPGPPPLSSFTRPSLLQHYTRFVFFFLFFPPSRSVPLKTPTQKNLNRWCRAFDNVLFFPRA